MFNILKALLTLISFWYILLTKGRDKHEEENLPRRTLVLSKASHHL